jgi:Mg2+ and Co2+ transporter CorA
VGYYGMNMELPFTGYRGSAIVIFAMIMALLLGYGMFSMVRRKTFERGCRAPSCDKRGLYV